jgi:putative peptidoglycan lipid II flippase
MEQKNISVSFLRTTALVIAVNILSKVLGVVREALIAGVFGAREATDAFFTAWRLPDILFNSLLGVLIANTFIPVYYELIDRAGESGARRFTAAAAGSVVLALTILALAYAIFAPYIIGFLAPGFDEPGNRLAVRLARVLAPVIIAGGITSIFRSLLHAQRRFMAPAFLPVVQNLCVIAFLLVLAKVYGVAVLAWGLLLSCALQAVMLFTPLALRSAMPWPRIDLSDPGLRRMGALMAPVLATFALGNVVPLVEVHLASRISTGAISYLSYAYRLFTLPEQIFVLAFSAVLFPFLAKDASLGDHEALTAKFSAGMRLSLYLMLPMGVFLAVYSREFVRLFLGWGAFDETAVLHTGNTLAAYAGGLIGVCARNLLVDACFAIRAPGLFLKISALMIPLNVGLDYWLSARMGAPGLSLGFSITAVVNAVLLFFSLRLRLGGIDQRGVLTALARSAAASAAMGLMCWLIRPWLAHSMSEHGFLWKLGALSLWFLAACVVYVSAQALLRSPEQSFIARTLRRKGGP